MHRTYGLATFLNMRHTLPFAPQFYVTAPQSCPYLDDRQERKLFTSLQIDDAQILNDKLSKQGFRRSQNVLYRPSCVECAACMSARVRVDDFEPTTTQRRIERKNSRLERFMRSPWATEEQYDLFKTYLSHRHSNGGMADMDVFEFAAMIEETPIKTRVIEYYDGDKLIACCLTDVLDDGLSLVYSFFDPSYEKLSLGTYVILNQIALAREIGLPYVYLGYWVPGSRKMGYKRKFSALEIFRVNQWTPLKEDDSYSNELHPMNTLPIAEQVANLSLPSR